MYERGAFQALKDLGFEGSWLQWFLFETESFHGGVAFLARFQGYFLTFFPLAKARRYTRYTIGWKMRMMRRTEHVLSYFSPDETPFTPIELLPKPLLPTLPYPTILYPNTINVNPSILSFYQHFFVPRITAKATLARAELNRARGVKGDGEYDDDGNYGSSATIDVEILQAISKRVHYGWFLPFWSCWFFWLCH